MRGLFGALAERKSAQFSPDFLGWMRDAFGSKAGVAVTMETALKVTTVLACARVLAEASRNSRSSSIASSTMAAKSRRPIIRSTSCCTGSRTIS